MKEERKKMLEMLSMKASAKEAALAHTAAAFHALKTAAQKLAEEINKEAEGMMTFDDLGEYEFILSFSEDTLWFAHVSQATTFPENHVVFKSPYIIDDKSRAFFGQIMVYNFMSESWKFNRLQDPGHLLARLFINKENHYYVEGVRPLHLLHPDIATNELKDSLYGNLVEHVVNNAIRVDLIAPSIQDVQAIPLGARSMSNVNVHGKKLGFEIEGYNKE